MDEIEIRQIWELAAQMWPSYPPPNTADLRKIRVQVWQDVLGDLDARLVRAALSQLGERDFFPPLGVIRRRALDIALDARGDRSPTPDEAWREVVTKLRQVGRQEFPEWSHPAVEAAVRTIGWIWICDSENMDVLRSHFLRFYGAISERFDHGADPLPPGVAAVLPEPFNRLGLGSGADGGT